MSVKSESYYRRLASARAKSAQVRADRANYFMGDAQSAFAAAYDPSNFASRASRTRAYNRDMRHAGPYARSIDSYNPRKNDWPGVDDIGVDGVAAIRYKDRVRRKMGPTSAAQAAQRARFAASARFRAHAARMAHGGISTKILKKMAAAQGLEGRSKMTAKELWLSLGMPSAYNRLNDGTASVLADAYRDIGRVDGPKKRVRLYED